MKKYYVRWGDFGNVYTLRYTVNAEQDAQAINRGYERITRKEAENLARAERRRMKEDPAFSGYASSEVYPW